MDAQRLDKWLWFAQVTKTRTLASGLVSGGHVRVNKVKTHKPGQRVMPGDVITIAMANGHIRVLKVVAPGERRGPAPEARELYQDLSPPPPPRPVRAGPRLTKRQRREILQMRRKSSDAPSET